MTDDEMTQHSNNDDDHEMKERPPTAQKPDDGGEREQHTQHHQQQREDKDTTLAADGYSADMSSSGNSGNDSDSPNPLRTAGEDKLGLVIEISPTARKTKKKHHHSSMRRSKKRSSSHSLTHCLVATDRKRKRSDSRRHPKRRKRGSSLRRSLPSQPAPSPIHPEIDISLTQHIAVRNGLLCTTTDAVVQGAAVSHSGSGSSINNNNKSSGDATADTSLLEQNDTATETTADEIASSVPALSNAVLRYFSELRNEIAAPMSKPKKGSTPPVASFKPKAQVISDVASFSDQPCPLEEALEITDTPRLLLECASPHRVIHVNAAFSRQVIMTGSRRQGRRVGNNTQEWIETQNKSSSRNKTRSLQEAIEEIIPENAALPLTCYPVLGSGKVTTHYLIEATANSTNARSEAPDRRQDTMKLYTSFEAVG